MLRKITTLLLCFLILLFSYGYWLDQTAENRFHTLYKRNTNGVITTAESIQPQSVKQDNAIMLVHGYSSSPAVFGHMKKWLKNNHPLDIYVPRLPFHGESLEKFKALNNQTIADYLKKTIQQTAKHYKTLTIIGYSYGGAQLIKLAAEHQLPANINLIFLSPGYYLRANSTTNAILLNVYGLWRDYCDYPLLGCQQTPNPSADQYAFERFIKTDQAFSHTVIPSVKTLFQFDDQNRKLLTTLDQPFLIIMSKDDNQVNHQAVQAACAQNKFCQFVSIPSGKHYFFLGKHMDKVHALIGQSIPMLPQNARF